MKYGPLNLNSGLNAFNFLISQETFDLQDGPLVKLLVAKEHRQAGINDTVPTGATVWINPNEIFAIGSVLPEDSQKSHYMVWLKPSAGDFQLSTQNGIHVLIPDDNAPGNPHHFVETTAVALAARLGTILDEPE